MPAGWYVEGTGFTVSDAPRSDMVYLDGIVFDRLTMERVRKAMEAAAERRGQPRPVLVDMQCTVSIINTQHPHLKGIVSRALC